VVTAGTKPRRGIDYIGVGVGGVIVNDQNEVLLLLRKSPPEAGTWTIPGGAVEWFETCQDAIRRECLEEVGLTVEVAEFLTVVDHIVAQDAAHWVSLQYLCRVLPGTVAVLDRYGLPESDEMRWFPIDAVPTSLSQPTRVAIEHYRNTRSGVAPPGARQRSETQDPK
jgi:8-oxo-dGTP diphosphatase